MPAKKKSKKKSAAKSSPILTAKVLTITFSCGSTCKAKVKHQKAHVGDTIVFIAVNTDVVLDFNPSPFYSGHKQFPVFQGVPVTEVVIAPPGEYFYSLSCDGCPSTIDDPSMIVVP